MERQSSLIGSWRIVAQPPFTTSKNADVALSTSCFYKYFQKKMNIDVEIAASTTETDDSISLKFTVENVIIEESAYFLSGFNYSLVSSDAIIVTILQNCDENLTKLSIVRAGLFLNQRRYY
jgi:hypothetical protein